MSNLVSFNIKSLQYLLRSLISLVLFAVLSPVYAATGTALSLTLISTGLVEPRLLHAATVVLNRRTFHIYDTTVHWTICVGPFSAISYLFWTSGPIRGQSPDYWDSAELIRAPIPRNGSGKPTTTTTRLLLQNMLIDTWSKNTSFSLCLILTGTIQRYTFTSESDASETIKSA